MVRVMDNDNQWSADSADCKKTITVAGKVLGVTVPPEAPKAGFSVLGLTALGVLGIIIRAALLL